MKMSVGVCVFSGCSHHGLEGLQYHVGLVGEPVGADKHVYHSGNNRDRRCKDACVNHTAKKPWQQNIRTDPGNIFDRAGMENVRLQRIQASMNPQEVGQGNYSAMVDFIEAGL